MTRFLENSVLLGKRIETASSACMSMGTVAEGEVMNSIYVNARAGPTRTDSTWL